MALCLDPDAYITFRRVIEVGVALGVPRAKAVQALSELLRSGELEREVDSVFMEVRIVIGTKADASEEASE